MLCKNCGHYLERAEGLFCSKCGTKIETMTENEPIEHTPDDKTVSVISATVFCTECGNVLADGESGICSSCSANKTSETPFLPQAKALEKPLNDVLDKVKIFVKKKPLMAAAGALGLLAVMVIVVVSMGRTFEPPYEVISLGRYDEISYIGGGRFLVMRGAWPNTRWGVEDVRGNELIAFGRFDMPGDEFLTHDGNFIVRDGRTFFILDSTGEEIASFDRYDWVSYVTSNRFIVSTGSGGNVRAGVVDSQGNEIIPLGRYTNISASQNGRWYIVWDGNRVGALNERGDEIISLGRYNSIQAVPGDRFIVTTGSWPNMRPAVLNSAGNEIISLGRYDEIWPAGDAHFIVREGGSWGVLNAAGNETIPFRYDSIHLVGNNNFIVQDGERWGVLDSRGDEIISLGRYDEISYARDGRFLVRSGGVRDAWLQWEGARWGVLDSRGNEIVPLGRYDEIRPVPGERFIVRSGGTMNRNTWEWEGARWGVIDARGSEIISPGRYDSILVFTQRWYAVEVDDGFVVRTGDRVGVRDLDGEEVIPLGRYDVVQGVYNGLGIVGRDERIGVINTRRIE